MVPLFGASERVSQPQGDPLNEVMEFGNQVFQRLQRRFTSDLNEY